MVSRLVGAEERARKREELLRATEELLDPIVAPARVSEAAREKARSKRTTDGLPVHSLRTLLGDLATITRNRVVPQVPGAVPFEVLTRPTALQREAFKLLGVRS